MKIVTIASALATIAPLSSAAFLRKQPTQAHRSLGWDRACVQEELDVCAGAACEARDEEAGFRCEECAECTEGSFTYTGSEYTGEVVQCAFEVLTQAEIDAGDVAGFECELPDVPEGPDDDDDDDARRFLGWESNCDGVDEVCTSGECENREGEPGFRCDECVGCPEGEKVYTAGIYAGETVICEFEILTADEIAEGEVAGYACRAPDEPDDDDE